MGIIACFSYCLSKMFITCKASGKVFNDPIHGHIELHPLLIKIIDTPQFQRMRNIKQLGGAYFVYPGASHNRFEHSLGVAYLAGELVETLSRKQPELKINDRDILCVKIAGLCHDLGHGPFSHLFDGMFIKEARPEKKWKHEKASVDMFDHLVQSNPHVQSELKKYRLTDQDLRFIKEMINPEAQTKQTPASTNWPHKGRGQEKSFLYEIVSNSTNGIDVDKFDYFARDSHHLGIQNNFDHRRFLKFARVCKVDGQKQKHICSRDKEEWNLIDMFNTRTGLHRRAYQHKVTKIIENMISDAFLKADKHIKIEGSGGKMFKLSTAIDDMEAYTKLTDNVFEQILNSSSDDPKDERAAGLKPAREILERVISRKLYVCLHEREVKISSTSDIPYSEWKKELAATGPADNTQLDPEDFVIVDNTIAHEVQDKKSMECINNIYYYSKHDPDKAGKGNQHKVQIPQHKYISVYWKRTDKQKIAQRHFVQWCKNKGFDIGKLGVKE
ncbi:deoxynucleoside triphosphate triphosphohydrolase SAMHD1-like [Mastacembelus armatus]|uniref:deoxynucleoside triphosphate triphosphohydrolase SAMHD1-like n=1 Tax=Mastacembelus armatus TaxID=205130 RepID=UPI000E457C0E|nr:deoxynucleoside triphosphate triphosphohydrolase SAMHD1-like [Mastacembelus armatus]